MTPPPLSPTTHLGPMTLLARDLEGLTAFYARLLGLSTAPDGSGRVVLSAHGTPLLRLEAAPDLPRAPVSRPGLYHTAFLLPTRADLGRWVAHAAGLGSGLGSGDHLVSEAFYLSDPEGNGIEVYADRPREGWTWRDGQVQMDTLAVDVPGVLAEAGITLDALRTGEAPPYAGAPAGTALGHVHLKVGHAAEAAQFYRAVLGLEVVSHLPGAAFLSWGGYHHHLGLNEWHTRGQGHPEAPAAGLSGFEVRTPDLAPLREEGGWEDLGDALRRADPWGNVVTVRRG